MKYDTDPIPPWGHVYCWLRRQWWYRRIGRLNRGGIHEASWVQGWDAGQQVASWQDDEV